ncbi:class I SAM-dependent methyltransferase [Laceyella putida]|uniref:Class I SAM-dependent methyltransferase n=1 Tax=Laceyella putida TaxID=110101 RepID=A0ABW2RNM1_9BACL
MSEHYFSANPQAKSDEREVLAQLLGHSLRFRTDAGVFSKKGVDFGSRLLVETAEIDPAAHVLDLGCGYGAVGIAIAKAVPRANVVMVDVNERAVKLAAQNAQMNRVAGSVQVLQSDGFHAIRNQQFDHILFNPPIRTGKAVIYRLFHEAADALKPTGSLWIVIRKQQGAASAKKELESIFHEVDVVEQKKGYWIICARKH